MPGTGTDTRTGTASRATTGGTLAAYAVVVRAVLTTPVWFLLLGRQLSRVEARPADQP